MNISIIFPENYKNYFPLYLTLLIALTLVILYFWIPGVKEFLMEAWEVLISNDEHRVKEWVENFSWFGPLILILAMIAQMFLVFIPTLVLLVVCILAYGPIYGSIIAFVAILSASSVGYGIGRYLGPGIVERFIGKKSLKKGSEFLDRYGFWAIFITRINPFLSNDAASLIGGILKMNFGQFIFATLTGIAPLILLIAIFGETTEELKRGLLWSSVATLIIFLFYTFVTKSFQKKSSKI